VRNVARRRGGRKSRKRSHVPKSPNIIAEGIMRIKGKPAAYRVYKKKGSDNILVATIHLGKTSMYNKSPRLGKKKKKRK